MSSTVVSFVHKSIAAIFLLLLSHNESIIDWQGIGLSLDPSDACHSIRVARFSSSKLTVTFISAVLDIRPSSKVYEGLANVLSPSTFAPIVLTSRIQKESGPYARSPS